MEPREHPGAALRRGLLVSAATRALINTVAANGFNTIRIPVAWDSHADQRTLQINPVWLARVKEVVDWAYAANLTVIINSHWDNGWFDSSGFRRVDSRVNKKLQSYWTHIANTFRDYDSRLLFCAANEPDVDSQATCARPSFFAVLAYWRAGAETSSHTLTLIRRML